ncbi:hypothetical protein SprV_0200610700 [Sparganum proliferum]
MFMFMTLALILLASTSFSSAADSCMKEGQTCSKTIFQRCCGELLCDLKSFGDGNAPVASLSSSEERRSDSVHCLTSRVALTFSPS